MATKKKAAKKKPVAKKAGASKKKAAKKSTGRTPAKKKAGKKNKLGVKNSLVNNINARKKKGTSRARKNSTIDKKSYDKMEDNWGKSKAKSKSKKA